jgi:antitoxin (DNA-binding transcriptional repressor) of toxin-antitoxin stability system
VVTVKAEIKTGQLADLVKQVQAEDEVLLTENDKPVAKIVSTANRQVSPDSKLNVRPIKGHRVLTPNVSQSEVADELFGRR